MALNPESPTPTGMSKEQIEKMTVNEGEWRRYDEFECLTCFEPAFCHPYTNLIWGCKKCGITTYSVSVYFGPAVLIAPVCPN